MEEFQGQEVKAIKVTKKGASIEAFKIQFDDGSVYFKADPDSDEIKLDVEYFTEPKLEEYKRYKFVNYEPLAHFVGRTYWESWESTNCNLYKDQFIISFNLNSYPNLLLLAVASAIRLFSIHEIT